MGLSPWYVCAGLQPQRNKKSNVFSHKAFPIFFHLPERPAGILVLNVYALLCRNVVSPGNTSSLVSFKGWQALRREMKELCCLRVKRRTRGIGWDTIMFAQWPNNCISHTCCKGSQSSPKASDEGTRGFTITLFLPSLSNPHFHQPHGSSIWFSNFLAPGAIF